jgi:hypothetical protein
MSLVLLNHHFPGKSFIVMHFSLKGAMEVSVTIYFFVTPSTLVVRDAVRTLGRLSQDSFWCRWMVFQSQVLVPDSIPSAAALSMPLFN